MKDAKRLERINRWQARAISGNGEGLGLPELEAMACETAVSAHSRRTLTEVFGNVRRMGDPRSVTTISAAMAATVVDPPLATMALGDEPIRTTIFRWGYSKKQWTDCS